MQEIPKRIWQTYKDDRDTLPDYIKQTSNTWIEHNPDYEYNYMNDREAADFILNVYGEEIQKIWLSLPLGVMRGDMWRYLIIYHYGGIYADIDAISRKPIDTWIRQDAGMIICPEHEEHFCQWIFAATPRHPAIKSIIEVMLERLRNPKYDIPHGVHYHTGPAVYTSGLFKYFGHDENKEHANLLDAEKWGGQKKSVYIYNGDMCRIFHGIAGENLYGSLFWGSDYVKWQSQIDGEGRIIIP